MVKWLSAAEFITECICCVLEKCFREHAALSFEASAGTDGFLLVTEDIFYRDFFQHIQCESVMIF